MCRHETSTVQPRTYAHPDTYTRVRTHIYHPILVTRNCRERYFTILHLASITALKPTAWKNNISDWHQALPTDLKAEAYRCQSPPPPQTFCLQLTMQASELHLTSALTGSRDPQEKERNRPPPDSWPLTSKLFGNNELFFFFFFFEAACNSLWAFQEVLQTTKLAYGLSSWQFLMVLAKTLSALHPTTVAAVPPGQTGTRRGEAHREGRKGWPRVRTGREARRRPEKIRTE